MPLKTITINNREIPVLIIKNVKKVVVKRKKGKKEYEWVEHYVFLYIPKQIAKHKLAVIPIDMLEEALKNDNQRNKNI